MKALIIAAGALALASSAMAADHHAKGGKHALVGAWTNGMGTLNIMPGGHFAAVFGNGLAMGVGTYAVDGDQLTVADIDGFNACETGATYTFEVSGADVTFAKIEDPCEGRTEAMDGSTWSRLPMPSGGAD